MYGKKIAQAWKIVETELSKEASDLPFKRMKEVTVAIIKEEQPDDELIRVLDVVQLAKLMTLTLAAFSRGVNSFGRI